MYVDTSTLHRNGKTYTRHLLRESFRENGKVKHRTVANLSHCSPDEIKAIRLALRHKHDLSQLGVPREFIRLEQGLSVGAVWLVFDVAKQLGINDALGRNRQGMLALWQVIARVIDQGSRLSAVRLVTYRAKLGPTSRDPHRALLGLPPRPGCRRHHQDSPICTVSLFFSLTSPTLILEGCKVSDPVAPKPTRNKDPGFSRNVTRLTGSHAACDVLGLERFNEDNLYDNLDWLYANQSEIEDRLFRKDVDKSGSPLFLYDVTSSYLEGEKNELAAFGYNRDGKRGKRQIVIGLLCNAEGQPLSIEVFEGNTQDPKTFASQVSKVAERFGGGDITFVGDRGMIKSQQIRSLEEHNFHYITSITKPQIEAMLKNDLLQMSLFDEVLAEIETLDGVRYIVRRNPIRAEEIAISREEKVQTLHRLVDQQNQYLTAHPRAKVAVALRKVEHSCRKLGTDQTALQL